MVSRAAPLTANIEPVSGDRRVDDNGLRARAGHRDPVGRLGIRPVRHQAAVLRRGFVVYLGVPAVFDGVKHYRAHRVSSDTRTRRRDPGAVDVDHLDARGRTTAARPVDGGAGYPDAPGPDVRAGPRRLADRRLRLAMDFPDQPATRRDRADSRGVVVSERSPETVGDV